MNEEKRKRTGREKGRIEGTGRQERGEKEEREGRKKMRGRGRSLGVFNSKDFCAQRKLFSKGFFVLSVAVPTSSDFTIIHKNKARKEKIY